MKVFITVCIVLVFSLPAGAETYSFTDEDGVVHFTNVPTDKRYQPVDPSGKKKKRKQRTRRAKRSSKVYRPRNVTRYDEYIKEASNRFNIPVPLIRAVVAVESNFDPTAVSHAGAQGLMQLMPQTAEEMGVDDPFDPRKNILGGTRYLRMLANAFDGDLVLTLAGYNAGHRAVFRHMDIPPFAETQRYVRRVLRLYYHYKKLAKKSLESR
jgi:soluble lytic murein transglycosylase-like protein